MNRTLSATLLAAWMGVLCLGCKTYKPVVVDQKTQLERDILGPFERLMNQPTLIAPVQGSTSLPTGAERALLQTVLDLQLNERYVRPLKDQQLVGEGREGQLELLVRGDDEELASVVNRENRLRKRLLVQLIAATPDLSPTDLPQLRRAFHQGRLRAARPGDRAQRPDGSWYTIDPGH